MLYYKWRDTFLENAASVFGDRGDNDRQKLEEYPTLKVILSPNWLERQYRKPENQFSSLMRWISSTENDYLLYLSTFENIIRFLFSEVQTNERQEMASKIRLKMLVSFRFQRFESKKPSRPMVGFGVMVVTVT